MREWLRVTFRAPTLSGHPRSAWPQGVGTSSDPTLDLGRLGQAVSSNPGGHRANTQREVSALDHTQQEQRLRRNSRNSQGEARKKSRRGGLFFPLFL